MSRPSPTLGQHNREVLGTILGLSDAGDRRAGSNARYRPGPARNAVAGNMKSMITCGEWRDRWIFFAPTHPA